MIVPLTPLMFLRRTAKLYPHKLAVVCGENRFSYSQFNQRIQQLSWSLKNLGVNSGMVIAYLSRNCHRLLEGYYGVIQTGAILLPINVRSTQTDLLYILNHSNANVLFLQKEFLPVIEKILEKLKSIKHFIILNDTPKKTWLRPFNYEQQLRNSINDPFPDQLKDENSVAELFYTSGTTAKPKGVMLTHRNLYLHTQTVVWAHQNQDSDIQLHSIPLFHANAWGATHSITFVGGTHVMLSKFRPAKFFQLIETEKVTSFNLVPTMASMLLDFQRIPKAFSTLRLIHLGGSTVPSEMVKQLESTFGCSCSCGYGLTETSPVLTISIIKSHLKEDSSSHYKRAAMTGIELPGNEVKVVDENGRDVRQNGKMIGEIITKSNLVMKGYWKQPEETAQAIKGGWFHTGDLATVDSEGYLMIVDRKKDIIIRGGENISSIEVEKTLVTHPAILECAVIAIPNKKWGETPKAFVVIKEDYQVSKQELKFYCRKRLATYKIPSSFEIVQSLPKGVTGKIQKKILRTSYWENP